MLGARIKNIIEKFKTNFLAINIIYNIIDEGCCRLAGVYI
jgi:hypothetical protein